ncbi:flagellar hook-associated protein FlgK [Anaerocolumna cellulosilytica]|nr:flagellar hook-associated protein FlgK [Anaerocolumna cellulosilytica]
MSSLYTGVSGLTTSQNALNTTAHNLTNINTKGYVRQQVVQADSTYFNWGVNHLTTFQTGIGVDIQTVRQVRDTFLDKSYRKEIGRQGFYEVQYEAVSEVESMLGELEGVAFQNALEELWESLQEVGKQPGAIESRADFIKNAQSFIERADIVYNQLNEYQVNLNTQITGKVNRINKIAEEIEKLNNDIRHYESTGIENANDLRDTRNSLIDELGKIINITYKEHMDGVVTVNAEGMPLVTESNVYKMGTAKISATSNLLKPVWTGYDNIDVYELEKPSTTKDDTDVGSLKGLLVARGDKQARYTDIPVRGNYATDKAYDDAVKNYNDTLNTSVIMTVQAQFDQLIHGVVTAINDILSPNVKVTLDDGSEIWILDEENAPIGMDEPDYTMGEALFNRKSVDRYSAPTTVNILNADGTTTSKSVRIYNEEDSSDVYTMFTIGEIEINSKISSNHSVLPLSSNNGSNEVDYRAAEALLGLWDNPFASVSPDTPVSNFKDYYVAFIGDLSIRGQQLESISVNQATMVDRIDSQRQQVIGVSSDEELTNLIKFQHAYNASSRFITVVDQMLEHILTRL